MPIPAWLARFAVAAAELAFGSACAGCDGSAVLLCPQCRESLVGPARLTAVAGADGWPVGVAAEYVGQTRRIVLSHKEGGRLGLAAPLGGALATSLVAVLESGAGCEHCGDRPVAFVPVPSTRSAVRRRGHDPLVRATRRCATVLRRVGVPGAVVPALRHQRRVADQAGLDAEARRANLAGALTVRPLAAPLLDNRCVIVVDDVTTTGATLLEARRALSEVGYEPCGAAVIAATPRQDPGIRVPVSVPRASG